MGGSGKGGFLLSYQQRKAPLFLIALPFLETTFGSLGCIWTFYQIIWTNYAHLAFIPSCLGLVKKHLSPLVLASQSQGFSKVAL